MTETTDALTETPPAAEAADPHVLAPDEARALLAGAPWRRFVVLGDSLAEGVGEASDGYADVPWHLRTVAALRHHQPELDYLNLGKRGLRVAAVRDGQLEAALAFRPDLAVVVCGGNDILAPDFSPDAVEAVLDELMGSLHAAGADVVTYTLQDITLAYPALAQTPLGRLISVLNDRVRAVAARYDAIVVEMNGHPSQGDPSVYSSDMIHASMRGHAIVASETIRALGCRLQARAGA